MTATKVASGSARFTNTTVAALDVVSSAMNGCALKDIGTENRLYCWGDANSGKLGDGRGDQDVSYSFDPVLVCVDCDAASSDPGPFPGPSSGSVPPPPPPTVATTVPETTTPPATGNDDTTAQLIIWAALITLAGATITLRGRHLN